MNVSLQPPRSAEDILQRLSDVFDELSPQLRRAAVYILDNPREVGVRSMRDLAVEASVRPNTLVRLAKQLGFDGYEALRDRFRDFVRTGLGGFPDRARWLQALAQQGGQTQVLGQMASATFANLEQMYQNQRVEELSEIADKMLAAERVFVLGLGVAFSLAHTFTYVARMAFDHVWQVPQQGSIAIDDVVGLNQNDLLLAMTFQPYRTETLEAVRLAKAKGVSIIGLTDSLGSPLSRLSDLALITPTHTPQYFQSNSAAAALLETLLAFLAAKGGDAAATRIEAFHRQRWDNGAYVLEPAAFETA